MTTIGFRLSEDNGKLLENVIAVELKRLKKEIYYFKEKNECDFLIKEDTKITEAIQVCYDLNPANEQREISGLIEALEKFKLKSGLILSFDQKKELLVEGKKITIKPSWQWILENKL